MKTENHTLEVYKLCVEMADRLSARRGLANTYYIGLESALSAGLGLLIGNGESLSTRKVVTLSLISLTLSLLWWIQITSHRNLSTAKYKVIHDLERELQVRPFTNEWDYIKSDRKWHLDLTHVERIIPIIFLLLNLLLIFTAAK